MTKSHSQIELVLYSGNFSSLGIAQHGSQFDTSRKCHSIGWSGAILPTKTKNSIRINFVQFARHSKVVEVLHWNDFYSLRKVRFFSFCLTSTNVLFYSDLFCAQMHFFQINSRWFENLAQPLFPDRERSVGWFGKFRLNETLWSCSRPRGHVPRSNPLTGK